MSVSARETVRWPSAPVSSRTYIGGVRFDRVTRTDAISRMIGVIEEGMPHLICTPNVDHVVQCQANSEFRSIINNCDLSIADGMGVVYASWLLGEPLPHNVAGRLLFIDFCRIASDRGYKICLLGGEPGIAEKAADELRNRFPGLLIVDAFGPTIGFDLHGLESQASAERVARCAPDALFVAFGAPKQEIWLSQNLHRLRIPVCIGVGYALDLLAGRFPLPPKWATSVGLEWLYRLVHDPVRLGKRYLLRDTRFLPIVLSQMLGQHLSHDA